ncbi:DUF6470 family protein [Bacillus dakarensis]|uniref:DUF6470 family protein n=1 Tax=Robertmurraya dakarensis TaxID=1926278 RepID=UPI0009810B5C|nr:DUF6470 family protein [Bacillus dakarensis]
MQLPSIQISTTTAQLAVKSELPTIKMRQPMADMTIKQPQADIQYIQKDAKLHIDQSEAFAEAGLKPVSRVIQEWAEKGKQKALQATARMARQGDMMMDLAKGGKNMIPQIAKQNSQDPVRDFNIGFVPSSASSVKINYIPGEFHVKVNQNSPEINIIPNQPQINIHLGSTEIYLKQKSSISFSIVGANIDYKK